MDWKKEFEKTKDIFIKILCDASFSRQEVIDLLDISLSNNKWKRIKNEELLKHRGNSPLDTNLPKRIKQWCEVITDDNFIKKTVQTVSRKKYLISKKIN